MQVRIIATNWVIVLMCIYGICPNRLPRWFARGRCRDFPRTCPGMILTLFRRRLPPHGDRWPPTDGFAVVWTKYDHKDPVEVTDLY